MDLHEIRKAAITAAPVALAGVLALQDALSKGALLTGGVPWAQAVVAALGALGVYLPGSQWAKFGAGLATAVGSTVVASITDNHVSQAEAMMVLVQTLAFVTAAVAPNKPQAGPTD